MDMNVGSAFECHRWLLHLFVVVCGWLVGYFLSRAWNGGNKVRRFLYTGQDILEIPRRQDHRSVRHSYSC